MNIPKKVSDRFSSELQKYKRILKKGKDKDLNESDTVSIITDMLQDVFGYDKYDEVTSEYAIKSTFCDLAIVLNNKLRLLIEVKAIGKTLSENHLNQALAYGAKEGLTWIILTNGVIWEIYRITMKPALDASLLYKMDLLDLDFRNKDTIENLFVVSKEGQSKNAIDELSEKVDIMNRHMISAAITEESVINAIRLQLNKISSIKANNEDVLDIVLNDIIKRDILDDDAFKKAKAKIKRVKNKAAKEKAVKGTAQPL